MIHTRTQDRIYKNERQGTISYIIIISKNISNVNLSVVVYIIFLNPVDVKEFPF